MSSAREDMDLESQSGTSSFCPATMCPLFAADGSPWTGEKNAPCARDERVCPWWGAGCSSGGPHEQVHEASMSAHGAVQVAGPNKVKRGRAKPRSYDCARAAECAWQQQSDRLCPPRLALSLGLDPRNAAY